MNSLPRILIDALLLAVLGASLGLTINHRLVFNAFAGRVASPAPAIEAARTLLPQPVLLADARSREILDANPIALMTIGAPHFSQVSELTSS